MTPNELEKVEYVLRRSGHRFVNETPYHTVLMKLIWPLFNRTRLKRFNELWDSGLSYSDCWKISKHK